MNKVFSLFAALLLAVSPFVVAEDSAAEQKAVKGAGLEVRSAHLSCAVELTKAHLDVLAKYLQKDVAALKSDLDSSLGQVKDAVTALDRARFDEAAKAVRDNVKKSKDAIVDARKGGGLKGDNAKNARADLKVAQDAYKSCQSEALKKEGEAKAAVVSSAIDKYQKKVDDLKERGADVSALQESIVAARNAQNELSTAVSSGDQKSIRDAMRLLRDLDLHLAANTAITNLRNVISKAEAKAEEKGITVDFSEAKAQLDKAAALAASGKKYGEGEFRQVWSAIKDAAEKIKGGVKGARKQAKEDKKAEKEARKDARKAEKKTGSESSESSQESAEEGGE